MNLMLLIAPVVVIIMGMSLMKIFMILVKRSLKLKLTLDPEEVDKGAPVRIIVTAEPQKPGHLQSLEGHLLCKKFDGYKGSWLERQDIPFISPGVVLSRIKFSYGENIELTPGEENKHIGIIAIPDDAEHTEYRGALQVHWFIQVRAHLGVLPSIVLEDELIVLRPVIYSGERLAFEEKKGDTSGADFYDPGFDLEEERMKPVEILAKKKEPKSEGDEPAGVRIDVDGREKPKIPIAPPPEEKKPYVPPPPKGDKSDLLRVQFKTPFMPKQNDQVLTDVRDLYRDPAPVHPQMRAPQTTAFTPGKLPESYPGAPGTEEEDKGNLLKVQYKTPWQPNPPQPGEEPVIYGQEPAEPSTGPQFRTPWRPDGQGQDGREEPVQSGPQYSKAPWRPGYGQPAEESGRPPAPQGPQFKSPWRQKQQEAQEQYAPQEPYPEEYAEEYPQEGYPEEGQYIQEGYPQEGYPEEGQFAQEGYPQEGYPEEGQFAQEGYPQEGYPEEGQFIQEGFPEEEFPQEEYPQAGSWQPQVTATEVQRADQSPPAGPFDGGYSQGYGKPVAGSSQAQPVQRSDGNAAGSYKFKNPWKPGSPGQGSPQGTPEMAPVQPPTGPVSQASAPSFEDSFGGFPTDGATPKPMGIRTRSPFRSDSPHKVDTPVFGQHSGAADSQGPALVRRSTTPLKKKAPGAIGGKADGDEEPARTSPADKFKTGEKPTLGAKPSIGEKPALKSTGSFAKLPRTFDIKKPGAAPGPSAPGTAGGAKIPLPSMSLKRAPFKPKDS